MIPKECKRLAEVDFPLQTVGQVAVKERYGAGGHPFLLHLWWARRPLAACRAMMLALLLPDPCDEYCPGDFKEKAHRLLPPIIGPVGSRDADLRAKLLKFIGGFANWKISGDPNWLRAARGLVDAAHPEEPPLVVDPFAGGGSIPFEALRVGCESFASDVNPVVYLILKAMLYDIPHDRRNLKSKLQSACYDIKHLTEEELHALYPPDPNGAQPIVYLWARTVRCEAPDCGTEIPIFRTPWLSKRGKSNARYFREDPTGLSRALLIDSAPKGGPIAFRIARGIGTENACPGFIKLEGTKAAGNNANVRCPCCGSVVPGNKSSPRTVVQIRAQRGGADVQFDDKGKRLGGAFLLAVVTKEPGRKGREYRLPTRHDYDAVWAAQQKLKKRSTTSVGHNDLPIPDEPMPPEGTLGFRVQRYGVETWGDLFTARQKLLSASLADRIASTEPVSLRHLLALALDRVAMSNMSLTRWNASAEKMQHTFGRQALPMVWDFAELCPLTDSPGSWEGAIALVSDVIDSTTLRSVGTVDLSDARTSSLPDASASVWFTDPPYYDAVPYSDLSDFFYVWLKRALPGNVILCDPTDPTNPLTPKTNEIVQDKTKKVGNRTKDKAFFENSMAEAFTEGRRVTQETGIGCVVFAHKTTEGWEALLSALIGGGWVITASWPIATEGATRLRARESAVLSTSVHLICRPRESVIVGDWDVVLKELPGRVGSWMEHLQGEGVRGADLVFACIGPALEIFSRYARVETAEGREVGLPEYLEKVWEVVGRTALEKVLGTVEVGAENGLTGGLEEDARLTALFLWSIQVTNGVSSSDEPHNTLEDEEFVDEAEPPRGNSRGYSLVYDVARRFAQPLGIRLPDWEGRIIETQKGVVRLMAVSERAKQLFGESGVGTLYDEVEANSLATAQLTLFPEEARSVRDRSRSRTASIKTSASSETWNQATTLDRVHVAMLMQASGNSQTLQNLLKDEQERGSGFLHLANALSALYPRRSEEKRLLDAMLLAVPK